MITKQVWKIGDCEELLKEYPSNFFKLTITSPPYNIKKDYGKYKDSLPWDEFIKWNEKILSELLRVSLQVVYIIGTQNNMEFFTKLRPILESKGWYYKTMYCPRYLYTNPVELALFISKEFIKRDGVHKPPILLNGQLPHWVPVEFGSVERLFSGHPCTFPERIPRYFIHSLTDEGNWVLDPFLGSGTTLKICRETNRNGLGIEINPDYESLIKKQLMSETPSLETWCSGQDTV